MLGRAAVGIFLQRTPNIVFECPHCGLFDSSFFNSQPYPLDYRKLENPELVPVVLSS